MNAALHGHQGDAETDSVAPSGRLLPAELTVPEGAGGTLTVWKRTKKKP
jgi:hypothetical protein